MANETLTVPCAICGATLPIDGVATLAVSRTRYACRSCVREASPTELERLKSSDLSATPSDATRAMMRTLADQMMFTAPTAAELVASSIRRALDALIAGDLVAFTVEGFALGDALEAVRKAMEAATPILRAIESLDPAYLKAANDATRGIAIRDYRRRFVGATDLDVIKAYAIHTIKCSHAAECIETAAILEECKARRIEVPKL